MEVEWEQALEIIKNKMTDIDSSSTAGFISASSTVEEQYLFQKWLRENNIFNIDHRASQSNFNYDEEDIFPKINIPIKDIEKCKSILLIDSNITYEQPILSHKIRKAFLKNHADLLSPSYWKTQQEKIKKGYFEDVFPYSEEERFTPGKLLDD